MKSNRVCTDATLGDLVGAYELGLLSEADRVAFERHLTHCVACTEELFDHAPVAAAMAERPEEILSGVGATATSTRRSGPLTRRRSAWSRWFLLLPAAAAAVFAFVLLRPSPAPPGFAALADLEPVRWVRVDTRAEGESRAQSIFLDGMSHYESGAYPAAAERLAEAVRVGEESPSWQTRDQAQFFLGMSHLLAGDAASAVAHLSSAVETPIRPLADRSRWYVAQAHLVGEDPDGALVVLDALAGGSPGYRRRAAELRDRVHVRMMERSSARER